MTTRRDPLIGAVTRARTAARFRSVALGPGFTAPEVAAYTARRHPPFGGGPCLDTSMASSVNAAADNEFGRRAGSSGGSGSCADLLADWVPPSTSDVISSPVGAIRS